MATTVYHLNEAKSSLSRLVDRAAGGEEIIVARSGKPVARLGPLRQKPVPRQSGGWEGRVYISGDFDEPLPPGILSSFERQV